MAGDWIKMRIDLQSHPKIVRILSATGADKFRTVGGLHAVWSVFDTHSADGVLHGYTPELLDHVIGWPGLSAAMIAVDWLAYDGAETLSLPEFEEHNGQSAKRRAEDQKRKRKARSACPQSVRNLSASDADKKRTREEKRRVSNSEAKASEITDALRDVSPETVRDFTAIRRAKRSPLTATAISGLRREAAKAGVTLDEALRICCERGWQGFKAEWIEQSRAPPPTQQQPSKTLAAIQALERMKNGGMAANRDHDGLPEIALLGAGSNPGD